MAINIDHLNHNFIVKKIKDNNRSAKVLTGYLKLYNYLFPAKNDIICGPFVNEFIRQGWGEGV